MKCHGLLNRRVFETFRRKIPFSHALSFVNVYEKCLRECGVLPNFKTVYFTGL